MDDHVMESMEQGVGRVEGDPKTIVWELFVDGELPPKICKDLHDLFITRGPGLDIWYVCTKTKWYVPPTGKGKGVWNVASVRELQQEYADGGLKYKDGNREMQTTIRIADFLLEGVKSILERSGLVWKIVGSWTFTPYVDPGWTEEEERALGWRDVR